LPTATGNGIEPAATNEFEVALAVALGLEVAVDGAADEVLPAAAPELLADAPHPARTTTAPPARAARMQLDLLI